MYWIEIVVYLKEDYSRNESIWVNEDSAKEEITKLIESNFPIWYYYDIMVRN